LWENFISRNCLWFVFKKTLASQLNSFYIRLNFKIMENQSKKTWTTPQIITEEIVETMLGPATGNDSAFCS
jgi:hypothetical protein